MVEKGHVHAHMHTCTNTPLKSNKGNTFPKGNIVNCSHGEKS